MDVDPTIEELAASLNDDADWSDAALDDRDANPEMIGPAIVNWREIEGEDRVEAGRALVEWVHGWLVRRYELSRKVIPDCWWRHPPMVEELSALHTSWLVSFDETDGGHGTIGWHERFALALTRSAFREKCADQHRNSFDRTMPEVMETF